jgi:hypothetical protein
MKKSNLLAIMLSASCCLTSEIHATFNNIIDPTLHSGWSRFRGNVNTGLHEHDNIVIGMENTKMQFTGQCTDFVSYYLYPYIAGMHAPKAPIHVTQVDQREIAKIHADAETLVSSYLDGYKEAWIQPNIQEYAFGDMDLGMELNKNREGYQQATEDRILFLDGVEAAFRKTGDLQATLLEYQRKWQQRHNGGDEEEFFIGGVLFGIDMRLRTPIPGDEAELENQIQKYRLLAIEGLNPISIFFDPRRINSMKYALISGDKFVSAENPKIPRAELLDIDLNGKNNVKMSVKALDIAVLNIKDSSKTNKKMSIEFDKISYWDYDWKNGNLTEALSNIASKLELKGRDLSGLKEIYFGTSQSKEISPGIFLSGARNGTVRFSNSVTYDGYIYSQGEFENDQLGNIEINSNVKFNRKIGYNPNMEGFARIAKVAMINVLPEKRLTIKDDVYLASGINLNKNSKLIINSSKNDIMIAGGINNAYITDDLDGIIKVIGSHQTTFSQQVGADDGRVQSIKLMNDGIAEFKKDVFAQDIELEKNQLIFNSMVSTGIDGGILFKNDGAIISSGELLTKISTSYAGYGTVILNHGMDICQIGEPERPIKSIILRDKDENFKLTGNIYVNHILDSNGVAIILDDIPNLNSNGYQIHLVNRQYALNQGLYSEILEEADFSEDVMTRDFSNEFAAAKYNILSKLQTDFASDRIYLVSKWLDTASLGDLNMLNHISKADLLRVIESQNLFAELMKQEQEDFLSTMGEYGSVISSSGHESLDDTGESSSDDEEIITQFRHSIRAVIEGMLPGSANNHQHTIVGNNIATTLPLASPHPAPPNNLHFSETNRVITRSVVRNINNRIVSTSNPDIDLEGASSGSIAGFDLGFWAQGFIGSASQKENATYDKYDAYGAGTIFGIDLNGEKLLAGLSLHFSKTELEFENQKNSFKDKIISFYGQYKVNPKFTMSGQIGFGSSSSESENSILLSEFEMKYRFDMSDSIFVTPKCELEYNRYFNDKKDQSSIAFELGSSISKNLHLGNYKITPSLYLGAEMMVSSDNQKILSTFIPTDEIAKRKTKSLLSKILDISCDFMFSKTFKGNIGFNYTAREDFSATTGYVKLVVDCG